MPEKVTHKKRYLVWLDILGFEQLATEIEEKKGIKARKVRTDFREVISDRVKTVEDNGLILGKNEGSDDWLIVTDSLNKVFELTHEVMDHHTGYEDYPTIPLEIAIGTGEYDKWASFQGSKLVIEDDTIEFLKTYIVKHYRDWYKSRYGDSTKSTFIILTESAHEDLRPLDKRTCETLIYEFGEGEKRRPIRFFAADVDKFLLRGKGLNFSKEIGYPGDEDYARIYDLYVPPIGYENIQKTLEKKRIVFITGTPEYGKTYTTVRLMWDYYTRGYEPIWVRGGELSQRVKVGERLERIALELRPYHILYFEDPFGKVRYEKREGLEREIGMIIDRVRQANDVYVIITSREEVFQEFERGKLSATELREFEQRLNLKRPSYDYTKRTKILLKRAQKEGCAWLEDEGLKNLVLEKIKTQMLPTTLNIRDFTIASTSVNKKKELERIIKKKSEETEKVFAMEIRAMTRDRQSFLTFPFILSHLGVYLPVTLVKERYQELVRNGRMPNPLEFDEVLKWFENSKIRIVQECNGKCIEFSHPAYSGSLKHLLKDGNFKEVFSKSLLQLFEKDSDVGVGALTLAITFERIPEDVRKELLLKLLEKDSTALEVARAVAEDFKYPPKELQDLLPRLLKRENVRWYFKERLEKLSGKDREALLQKLPEAIRRKLLPGMD